ncbi:MAG: hypothetical protein EPO68_01025, partial [Planctomycetota bacterium]
MSQANSVRSYLFLSPVSCVGVLAGSALLAASTRAQLPDYLLGAKTVIQTVQTGSTPLSAGKSTMVRAPLRALGTVPPGTKVDALMRVFVNGIETPYSPLYSDNGPLTPPAFVDPELENTTLNFLFVPPQANNVELRFELNPPGPNQVLEANYANNNSVVTGLVFHCRRVPEIVYVPVDYRPNGETQPNLPPATMTAPGNGDNFLAGIYPSGDWNYHRSVAPSKLWTQSVAGSGSAILSALITDQNLMVPKPDLIYGWIPGPLPGYNGQAAGIPATAGMGNTEEIRYQRTFAHEIGHCHGLQHNSTTNSTVGVDVENHLNTPLALPTIKSASLKDIMYAGLLTPEAWVSPGSYEFFIQNLWYACGTDAAPAPQEALLVAGLWNRAAGTVALTDVLVTPDGVPTATVPLAQADMVLRAWSNGVLVAEAGLNARNTHDTCPACRGDASDSEHPLDPVHGFSVVIASSVDPDRIDKLALVDGHSGSILVEKLASAHAPELALVAPNAGAPASGVVTLAWRGSDADGDALKYYVRYSPDGTRVVPLHTQLTIASVDVDFAQLPKFEAGGWLEVIASDGLATTSVRTSGLAVGGGDGASNAPLVYIATPDDAMTYPKSANVILHGNAWDLEDQMLSGASLTWTSNLDGQVAIGRLARTAALSVGTHVITLRAQDSSGAFATDTTTITITDRPLPGGALICQPSLGSGGPGSSALAFCGGDLSTGTIATLTLSGAKPSTPAWIAIGTANNPTPIFGGTVVPVPFTTLLFGSTNASGTWTMPNVPG